jgi:leukotriene-A4 hydrolase
MTGMKALQDSVAHFGADHEFTKLQPDLHGVDPDDAFSSVPCTIPPSHHCGVHRADLW